VQAPKPWSWGSALNAGVAACDTDWITWIGIDDTYLPIALSGWEEWGYDIVCFGLQTTHGYVRRVEPAPTREQVLDTRNRNLIPCGSPFKRRVWEQTPFDPVEFTPYEDWAFGVQAVYRGASVGSTCDIDYTYTIHHDQVSATAPKEALFAARLDAWMIEQGRVTTT
jgi:hypothetical protein